MSDAGADGGELTLSSRAARPVLARVFGALGARAELPVERVSDLLVVADLIASAHPDGAAVRVAFSAGGGRVELVVGPLADAVVERLINQPKVEDVAVLPRLADDVEVAGSADDWRVRLRFA
jgi:hypothetical protein